jgi:hypothetical protein
MSGSCGWFPMKHGEIAAWVEAHRDSLPQTLAELSEFPIAFRKVIVNMVSPELRTSLWREHLGTFIGPQSALSPEQQELVRDAQDQLPELFGGSQANFETRAKALEDRMRLLITPQQAAQIFGTLGPPEPPEGLPLPADAHPGVAG